MAIVEFFPVLFHPLLLLDSVAGSIANLPTVVKAFIPATINNKAGGKAAAVDAGVVATANLAAVFASTINYLIAVGVGWC